MSLSSQSAEPDQGFLQPEQKLADRYRVIELLGQGGFAAVYRGWDEHLQRPIAIKENHLTNRDAQRQFEREAKLLARLHHPNLPRVTDHFVIPGHGQFLVMDYIEGQSLYEYIEESGPVSEAQALEWLFPICDALSYLHSQEPPIIHRDIKPQNIILGTGDRPYLVDFGIAKTFTINKSTTAGALAISPGYSPPEQYGKSTTDICSDVYSLGATLYTLLTGDTPSDSVDMMTGGVPRHPPARERNAAISAHVSAAIERAMELNRAERFDNVEPFRLALRAKSISENLEETLNAFDAKETIPVQIPDGSTKVQASSSVRIPELHPEPVRPARLASVPRAPNAQGSQKSTSNARFNWGMPILWSVISLGMIGLAALAWIAFTGASNAARAQNPVKTSLTRIGTPENGNPIIGAMPSPTLLPPDLDQPTETSEPEPSSTPLPDPTPLPLPGQDSVAMVNIPAGEFSMGMDKPIVTWHLNLCNQVSTCNLIDYEDAMPAHNVALSSYSIDIHEVTNQQYQACVRAGICPSVDPTGLGDNLPGSYSTDLSYQDYPVVGISWDDALAYCKWVGKTLPTEAQWERAAGGNQSWLFTWGQPSDQEDLDLSKLFRNGSPLANYCDEQCSYIWRDAEHNDGWAGPAPVMNYPPSPSGIYDLIGNVQEWVLDFYSAVFYNSSPYQDPVNLEPAACPARTELDCHLTRGGGWNNGLYHATSRWRHYAYSSQIKPYRGFRCVSIP